MSVTIVRSVDEIPRITFATDAAELAHGAYEALLALLEQLDPDEWSARTECPAWDVADMVGHMIGAAEANASLRETLRQVAWGLRHKGEFDGNDLDAMNAFQVRKHAALSPAERVAALRSVVPGAVRGRMRFPRPLRRIRGSVAQSGSTTGMPDSASLGHLMEVIYTRDVWMHRVDIARATGRPLELNPAVDGRIIEDVVAEWAAQHGQAFQLTLTGTAGGAFRQGDGGPRIELDAVEFCRTVSGRIPGEGLLRVLVLF